ncbi:MAG: malto-oligosyltrehalose trehalohydrolase [Candidatus Korobacteraceae bacterium]
MNPATQTLPYGANLNGAEATFRVWAPYPNCLMLRLMRKGVEPEDLPMRREGQDRVTTAAASAGDRYFYVLDDGTRVPDPVSRFLPEGVHGPTEIVDPASFRWSDQDWRGLALRDYIIYELHIGSFTPQGTFDTAAGKLEYLKQLGVTVIEVMPVAACPGTRNWGYDGVSPYAVQPNYGGPDGFKRFIDAAHRLGLAVMLDVVYNHLGPEGNYLPKFGPYFTAHHKTPWGDAVNYDADGCEHVRRYVVENALYWIREYHLDGLRLDAVQTIKDDSPRHILADIQQEVQAQARELGRTVCVIAETDENDSRYIKPVGNGGYGLDAVWSDDFHHAVHAFFTGERQGYYQDFGKPEQIARALREGYVFQGEHFRFWNAPRGTSAKDVPLPTNVICIQNHDQVGNRAKGERLTALVPRGVRKLAAAFLLLAPHTPLLFMGEEYDEAAPFQFFTDFHDPQLKKAVSAGRRSEFKDFDFSEIPDPEDPATFERSKLTWADATENREMLEWYQRLLQLRKQYVTGGERTAEARYAEGVLTMLVPRQDPKVLVRATLQKGGMLPPIENDGWHEVLRWEEDGYAVSVSLRLPIAEKG